MIDNPIVLVSGARTPTGSFAGALSSVAAHELGAHAIRHAVIRAGLSVDDIDEYVLGCVGQVGAEAFVARRAALAAGARPSSGALAVNRLCGSGLQAIATAADGLRLGHFDMAIAGGCESMTRQPFMDFEARAGYRLGHHSLIDGTLSLVTDPWGDYPMGTTAENVAKRFDISRQAQDEFAVESQRRAQAALATGAVADEIAPLTIRERQGERMVDTDEHPRAGITLEKLAAMKPAFASGGTVTAGNSSGINDGGAALVMTTAKAAAERGIPVLGELIGFATAGVEPEIMGYAPRYAIEKVLVKTGLTASQIGWIEL
ncbi:MAG: thiolase family protein, partial [Propionibacteriaceae bacterium]|nr:thiolase family protein [Propionibacteriaceae bacterium]